MKTNRITQSLILTLALATLAVVGRAQTTVPPLEKAPDTAATPDPAFPHWSDVKDFSYDTRVQFFSGFKRLEARVKNQVDELTAKRTAMKASANTQDWDFAMKEMVEAQAYLKASGEELRKTTAETWDQQKEKVGVAWTRTQDAYGKVKASITN